MQEVVLPGQVYQSGRYFQVWQYTVTYNWLLLRSTRDEPLETRIDIHFPNVSLMLLRPTYDGLVIREASADECSIINLQYDVEVQPGRLFALGADLKNFVVSARPQLIEDDEGFDNPSLFGRVVDPPWKI